MDTPIFVGELYPLGLVFQAPPVLVLASTQVHRVFELFASAFWRD